MQSNILAVPHIAEHVLDTNEVVLLKLCDLSISPHSCRSAEDPHDIANLKLRALVHLWTKRCL
jgi:hypothetical protein